jgi:hypothetical protein
MVGTSASGICGMALRELKGLLMGCGFWRECVTAEKARVVRAFLVPRDSLDLSTTERASHAYANRAPEPTKN